MAHTASRKLTEVSLLCPFQFLELDNGNILWTEEGLDSQRELKKGIWQALFITWVWGVFVIILSYTVAPYLILLSDWNRK